MLMSMTHVSPTGAIHPPSARRCPREATNASVPWDVKGGTARKVIGLNTVYSGVPPKLHASVVVSSAYQGVPVLWSRVSRVASSSIFASFPRFCFPFCDISSQPESNREIKCRKKQSVGPFTTLT